MKISANVRNILNGLRLVSQEDITRQKLEVQSLREDLEIFNRKGASLSLRSSLQTRISIIEANIRSMSKRIADEEKKKSPQTGRRRGRKPKALLMAEAQERARSESMSQQSMAS